MNSNLRALAVASSLGVFAVLFSACPKPCGPDTCASGCCANNTCVESPTNSQCGTGGQACSACGDDLSCVSGVCMTMMTNDGGNGVDAGLCMNDMACSTTEYCGDGGVCTPKCRVDNDCKGGGRVCSPAGRCEVGRGCQTDQECQIVDDAQLDDGGFAENDPCYRLGIGCRCDLSDGPPGSNFSGTCRQRLGPCEKCTANIECGQSVVFQPPGAWGEGKCAALPGDMTGDKYCLYQRVGQCSCGTVDDGTGYCRPQTNSCQQVGCGSDRDCNAGSVCSVNDPDGGSCGGVCKPRCRWDFRNQELAQPGCPPGETCWVDSANLDPSSPFYGSGRCRPPCSSSAECQQSADNPFGGTNLKCAGEEIKGGGTSPGRCRANGECMDNLQCPEQPAGQPYIGYCDRGSFQCKTDCRVGTDPLTNKSYSDCQNAYTCVAATPTNICRRLTCAEQGGASAGCSRGELCAFEDKDGDGRPEHMVPASLQNEDGCYEAPRVPGPFCKQCMSHADCENLQAESWFTCANGAKNPSCSLLPSRCIPIAHPMGGMAKNLCGVPTLNDFTTAQRAHVGCPQGYTVRTIAYNEINTQGDGDMCATNDDCNLGTDAGRCAEDPSFRRQDGGLRKVCRCTAGTGSAQCPNVDGGVKSTCRNDTPGATTFCLDTVVCVPNSWAYGQIGMPNVGEKYSCGLAP